MPRLVYLTGVGIGLVAIAFALTCQVLDALPGVTEANVRRIKPGMLRTEVEALFGRAADVILPRPYHLGPGIPTIASWSTGRGAAYICFEGDGRVSEAAWHLASLDPPPPLAGP